MIGSKRRFKPKNQRSRKRPFGGGVGIFEEDGKYTPSTVQVDILPLCYPPSKSSSDICKERIHVVRPYPFVFGTFAKARWIGRSILDVYVNEFGSYPSSYYEAAIKQGRILVSGNRVDCEYKIKGQDELSHTVHRHEPAVRISDSDSSLSSKPYITIIHQDEDIIVVDKPCTMPIHPCGSYHFNSMFHILTRQDESLEGKLYNVHRLDRLTSGLTIIAKTSEIAKSLGKCIVERDGCDKIYLARVKGKFPLNSNKDLMYSNLEGSAKGTAPCVKGKWRTDEDELNSIEDANAATCIWISDGHGNIKDDKTLDHVFHGQLDMNNLKPDGSVEQNICWLNLAVPCSVIDHKHGICKAGTGKASQTAFAVLGYDEDTDSTVVLAKPLTGRTHQIRLHLQFLGHPIANDPCYGGTLYYADQNGELICKKVQEKMNEIDMELNLLHRPTNATSTDTPATETEIQAVSSLYKSDHETMEDYICRSCVWCNRNRSGGEERAILEFLSRSPGIWLHAFQYSMEGAHGKISYKTCMPPWVPTFQKVIHSTK